MQVLNNIKQHLLRLWRSVFLKYALVIILGIAVVGFLGDNSVWQHMQNLQLIHQLTEEKDKYNADYERDQAKIRELDRNPKAMEKIARERYFMKAEDEDIFVLSDDERAPQTPMKNETTE